MDFLAMPKIELHCHLDGSLRPETIIDIALRDGIQLPSYERNELQKELIAPLECESLDAYLKRFSLPNLVMQSKENLRRITFELFEDAAKENVKYMEVSFAPLQNFPNEKAHFFRCGMKVRSNQACLKTR